MDKINRRDLLVSIIIPTYNYGQHIHHALKSLQTQSLRNWECWVIDDGSIDETADIVSDMAAKDPRIHYYYQLNQGQAVARNTGISLCSGAFIQFLDADDILQEKKLSEQVDYLIRNPHIDIVYGPVQYFQREKPEYFYINRWGNPDAVWMPGISAKGYKIIRAFVEKNILELGSALFRKEAVLATGSFNKELTGLEDYDFCFRAAFAGLSFSYLNKENSACLMLDHINSFSKQAPEMYFKELLMRKQLRKKLRGSVYRKLIELNDQRYDHRMKRLMEYWITQTLQPAGSRISYRQLQWIINNSSLAANLFFIPRMIKAFFKIRFKKQKPAFVLPFSFKIFQ